MKTDGKPLAIYYLDKYSIHKMNHQSAVDNSNMITQFQRMAKALGTHLISTNSPQAKGQVERLHETFQDRLVKELRLRNINTIEEANIFLKEYAKT